MPLRTRSRRLLLAATVLVASAAAAPAAHAAIGVTDVTVTPGTTQAAAPSSFALGFRLSDPGQQVKDLTIHLPPGLVGNPLAQPACRVADFTADRCAPASAVGTSKVNADPGNLTIDGTIYNLVAGPGEPARLGIVYRNPAIAPLFVQSSVALRPDGGLDSIIKDLPRTARLLGGLIPGEQPTTVKGISLVLNKAFAANPTSCAPARTTVDVTSYAAPATVASGSASFTPTGCDRVPFAPRLAVNIGNPERRSSPSLTTVITQGPGEAGIRDATVTLPVGISANPVSTPPSCSREQAAASACPENSVVGTAAVRSPLLAEELKGKVFFVTGDNVLPSLRIELTGALRIVLDATVGFAPTGALRTTIAGIPDVPVSRFELAFRGGRTGGVLTNNEALCAKARTFGAAFTSQAGATRESAGTATVTGCPKAAATRRPPRATARVAAGGTLVLTARAGTRAIRGLRVSLARRPAAGRRTSSAGRLRLAGRVATVSRLPRSGSRQVVVRLGGARRLRGTRATVTVRDAGGRTTRLRVLVR